MRKKKIPLQGDDADSRQVSSQIQNRHSSRLRFRLPPIHEMRLLVEMQSPVLDLIAHRGTEDLRLLSRIAQNPREQGRGIRADRVHDLRLVIFPDLLELFVFGPWADWELEARLVQINPVPRGKNMFCYLPTLITSR